MSSKFVPEPDSRKTFAVRRRFPSTTRSASCSVPQLFGSDFDDAPWHGHKIIAADSGPLGQGQPFSSASAPHSYFVTNRKLSEWSRTLIQSPTGCQLIIELHHCKSRTGSDTSRVCRHKWLSGKYCNRIFMREFFASMVWWMHSSHSARELGRIFAKTRVNISSK